MRWWGEEYFPVRCLNILNLDEVLRFPGGRERGEVRPAHWAGLGWAGLGWLGWAGLEMEMAGFLSGVFPLRGPVGGHADCVTTNTTSASSTSPAHTARSEDWDFTSCVSSPKGWAFIFSTRLELDIFLEVIMLLWFNNQGRLRRVAGNNPMPSR